MGDIVAIRRPSPCNLSSAIGEEALMRLTLHISLRAGDPFPLILRLPATFKAGESSELFRPLGCLTCWSGFSVTLGD